LTMGIINAVTLIVVALAIAGVIMMVIISLS
jgi:hypothetical protein